MARVNGEGSWDTCQVGKYKYQRFRAVIDGKQKPFYGRTKTEAMKKYKEYMKRHTPGQKKTSLTICDVAYEAIEKRKWQLKETTYDFYQLAIKRLKKDEIGDFQIQSVTQDDVQEYLNSLASKDSKSVIKRQRVILSITFSYAEDNGLVDKNIMHKVKLPHEANIIKQEKEHVFLSTEERRLLEKESERLNDKKIHNGPIGTPLYGITAQAVIFILHTGLRAGELFALFWEDVDLDSRFIHIKRNAPTSTRKITTPKRKASIRTIPIDNKAYEILNKLSEDKNGNLVFHTKNGTMLNRNDMHRTLYTMMKRAGIDKKPRIHDLRHTYASELIRNGVDMKTVQVVLGHSDIATTMNIYVHKSNDDLEGLKNLLN